MLGLFIVYQFKGLFHDFNINNLLIEGASEHSAIHPLVDVPGTAAQNYSLKWDWDAVLDIATTKGTALPFNQQIVEAPGVRAQLIW